MNERNNVLLVVLDSVRAKNTSLHGHDRETTPFLSEFADRSTVYTQARAPGIHSIASHVSMFTGEHVEEHRAMRHTTRIEPSRTIWHELGADFGYETGLFTNNRIVSNASNLSESFGHIHEPRYPLAERIENKLDGTVLKRTYFRAYDGVARLTASIRSQDTAQPDGTQQNKQVEGEPETTGTGAKGGTLGKLTESVTGRINDVAETVGLPGSSASGYKTLYGKAFTDAFLEWESGQNGPWAACINLMDPHSPYEPNPEFDRWAQQRHWQIQAERKPSVWETLRGRGWDQIEALEPLYDGAIRQSDAIVRDLVTGLEDRGLLSETLLIVTSDHGEAFGERSRLNEDVRLRDHKWGIHEVLTHVPLVISYPGQNEAELVTDPVSLTDMPAVMRTAATDEAGPEQLIGDGVVLASTFRLPEEKVTKYRSVEGVEKYVGPWRAVYETRDGSVRKFAQKGDQYVTLDVDRTDDVTIQSREPHERVAEVYDPLSDSDLVTQKTTEIDEELEKKLEDLGYIR